MKYSDIYSVIDAALKAGKKILSIYDDPNSDFEIERKADNSPLTIADRLSNEIICEFLNKTPYPVLSEEGKHLDYAIRKSWKDLWVVDPLDGTKEFIKRNGEFTVNIALVHEGVPVWGVIYVPVKHELYFATEETGAYKVEAIEDLDSYENLDALMKAGVRLPSVTQKEKYVVVASRSHLSPETQTFIDALRAKHQDIEIASSGSSLKICLVAEGKADIYPRFAPTMEWDTAAGHAIVRAAGCEIYQAEKDAPLAYNKEDLLNPWFIVEPKRN